MLSGFHRRLHGHRSESGERGFTIIELMIVITIIMILMAIAAGRYQSSIVRAREAALHQDLFIMRQAIQQYTLDKDQAPSSLQDLIDAKYLGAIPVDPITRAPDWSTDPTDALLSPDQLAGGIGDVHSRSGEVSPFEQTPYSTW